MKKIPLILVALLMFVLCVVPIYLFLSPAHSSNGKKAKAAKEEHDWYLGTFINGSNIDAKHPMKLVSTNANGETFTMYVGGLSVGSTNWTVSSVQIAATNAATK